MRNDIVKWIEGIVLAIPKADADGAKRKISIQRGWRFNTPIPKKTAGILNNKVADEGDTVIISFVQVQRPSVQTGLAITRLEVQLNIYAEDYAVQYSMPILAGIEAALHDFSGPLPDLTGEDLEGNVYISRTIPGPQFDLTSLISLDQGIILSYTFEAYNQSVA